MLSTIALNTFRTHELLAVHGCAKQTATCVTLGHNRQDNSKRLVVQFANHKQLDIFIDQLLTIGVDVAMNIRGNTLLIPYAVDNQ